MGAERYAAGDFAGALVAAEESIGRAPDRLEGLRLRSMALLALGRWDDAFRSAELTVALIRPDQDDGPRTIATSAAIARAVGLPDEAERWELGASAPAAVDGSTDATEPVAELVVGSRVESGDDAASAAEEALREQERVERLSRPSRVARDLIGTPLGLDKPGGLIVHKRREVPDVKASLFGLAVLAVLAVAALAWMCAPRTEGPAGTGAGSSTTCVGSALDLRGEPVGPGC